MPKRAHTNAKSRKPNIRGWRNEKKDHPWTSDKQAKMIAADHNAMKKK